MDVPSRRLRRLVVFLVCLSAPWLRAAHAEPVTKDEEPRRRVVAPRTMLCQTHVGPLPGLGSTTDRVLAWMREQAVAIMGPVVVRYPKGGGAPSVRVPVAPGRLEGVSLLQGASVETEPAGLVAVHTHEGALSALVAAWAALERRVKSAGWHPTGGRAEVRLDATASAPLRTELRMALTLPSEADVAVYVGAGAGPASIETASSAVDAAGYAQRPVTEADLRAGRVGAKTLLVPGGWSPTMREALGREGQAALRRHVEKGGGYVGICAGAWLVCQHVVWEGATTRYPESLLPLRGEGPLPATPWPSRAVVDVRLAAPVAKALGTATTRKVLYWGGGWFGSAKGALPKGLTPMAHYAKPAAGRLAVAALKGRAKAGRVFLTGPHFEFDLLSDRDGHAWPEREETLPDTESDWDVFHAGLRYVMGEH